jgi:hypothetical protein
MRNDAVYADQAYFGSVHSIAAMQTCQRNWLSGVRSTRQLGAVMQKCNQLRSCNDSVLGGMAFKPGSQMHLFSARDDCESKRWPHGHVQHAITAHRHTMRPSLTSSGVANASKFVLDGFEHMNRHAHCQNDPYMPTSLALHTPMRSIH